MKQKFINHSIHAITKHNSSYTDTDIEKLKYGLEGIYLTITKAMVILFLAIILQILPQVLAVLFFFNIIRFTGFGFHAEKSSVCLILSIFSFIVLTYFFLNIHISFYLFLIIGMICTFFIALYAPADTAKRPLKNKRKRVVRKIITTLISCLYIVLGIFISSEVLVSILITALVGQVIVILPLTYRLFNGPYRNYEKQA